MKKKTFAILALAVLVLGGSLGMSYAKSVALLSRDHKESLVEVDWVSYFEDYRSAAKDADLIVIGHVKSSHNQVDSKPFPIASTVSTVTIKDVLKNKIREQSETIQVYQTGGILDGVIQIPEEVSLLESNQDYLLFLNSTAPHNTYGLVSGWQGSIPIVNGKLAKTKRHKEIYDGVEEGLYGRSLAEVQTEFAALK